MKNIGKALLLLVLVLVMNCSVLADTSCARDEKRRLKELANKIEYIYDYEIIETKDDSGNLVKQPVFSITATNLNSDLKVIIVEDYYLDKYKEFKNSNANMGTLNGFLSGDRIPITVLGYTSNGCAGEEILKKYIRVPYYNFLSEDIRCAIDQDFKYCAEILDNPISQSTFDSEYAKYIEDMNRKAKVESNESDTNILLILEIVGSIVIALTVIIIIVVRRRKKYQL